MACKDICLNFNTKQQQNDNKKVNGRPYREGFKFCRHCSIRARFPIGILYCPCCGFKLRVTPYASKCRMKYHEERQVVRY